VPTEKTKDPAKKKAVKPEESAPHPGVLETVAKAIGSTIGEIAVKTGVVSQPEGTGKPRAKKLVSKDKKRVPRKLKKRLKKESTKSAAK
jgi:hypothetical protein